MKFTNGYWDVREGVKISSPVEVRDINVDGDSVSVWAACKHVEHRGDTLNEPLITVGLSSPMEDVICVKLFHHSGKRAAGPEFELYRDSGAEVSTVDEEDGASLVSGRLTARVNKKGRWRIDFLYDGKRITGTGNKGMGYITGEDKKAYVREQLDLGIGEYVYGLGERFTPFVKNGQTVDIWNEDGGTSSELAYKNIPFYITNNGYGVFVNHCGCVSFEIASENVSRVQFSVPGECLEYYIIGGGTPKKVLENYTILTGRPALPPAWSFGLWLTTSFTTSYDETTVNSFIDGMLDRDIPLSVFHFDCFWMKEYQWCDFEWHKKVFPDPEGMLKRLKGKGLKVCVWINPYIAQKSCLFKEGMDNGYFIKTKDGDVWQWDKWQAGMAIVDFTNPRAAEWFKSKLKRLIDMGVDCFKTDFGERIPQDAVYFDGSDAEKMHNYYTYLYNRTVYEALEKPDGNKDTVLFARSATAGSQKFPVHWGGDCSASYDSMAESLRGGLSLCLSGFGFWSHDIGGFEKTATPDIYKRWTAFGLLSSHSRLHGNESYRVPWLFDQEAVDVLRFFTRLKYRLMPYLFGAACEASSTGIPMMRAMVLEYPGDPLCKALDLQYMLGASLLVAPVFNSEGAASYYLPKGVWTNFLTGKRVEGSCWRQEEHSYMSIPLMVREGAIIPVGSCDSRPDYDYAYDVDIYVYGIKHGFCASASVYNTCGQVELRIEVKCCEGLITVDASGAGKPWNLVIPGECRSGSVENGSLTACKEGMRVIPNSFTGKLCINIGG
ncbi:alpha-D-xyloside xylohydrolase [Anaerobacterium chartisolvens]|uniref:alpha-D-xyloside xylohydrolase n=1 Tax=Anaerobacterium chartisolvens TaxID=1297424 RepID=A0A369AT69_9FIRM|nr:alpha-xylosidase [Anaerobacterium chartisolvens]RCX12539.1 alpha-D-xyloside xylohydrolase [Anaerobacterium chartisolvens]